MLVAFGMFDSFDAFAFGSFVALGTWALGSVGTFGWCGVFAGVTKR
jgi:hypothetical protein